MGDVSYVADTPVIDIKRISKTYRRGVRALDGLSLAVGGGQIFGLLGPNGAGKSTLVKALLTIIRPSQCEGTMLGKPIGSRSTLQRVGYLPEHVQFPDYLTGTEVIDYCGALSKVSVAQRRKRSGELLDLVGMSKDANRKLREYSKGMKQRIGIAQALINDPDIVFLDEPTDGVDPSGRREIREVLGNIREQGKTVFVNSHLLGEMEMIGDRVAILVGGKVVKQGAIGELTEMSQGAKRYEITFPGAIAAEGAVAAKVAELGGSYDSLKDWTKIQVPTDDAVLIQPVIDLLRKEDKVIAMVEEVRPTLEELFIDAIEQEGAL